MIIIKTYYIKKVDKPKSLINKIKLNQEECKIYSKLEKEKQMIKIIKKMQKREINNIVIEKELYKNQKFINYINSANIKIFDGRWLIKYLTFDLLDYIIKQKQIKKEETELAITVNEITDLSIQTIERLARQYKKITVVTNHINKLRNIEKNLYEQEGILIILSNNQKKSLLKAHIILNMDFNNEIINRYKINENAIILNLEGSVKIENKRFNGININDYEIEVNNKEIFKNKELFYEKDLLESILYKRDTFINIRKSIEQYDISIKQIYGIHGKIVT